MTQSLAFGKHFNQCQEKQYSGVLQIVVRSDFKMTKTSIVKKVSSAGT
jgi:hypothetical protein